MGISFFESISNENECSNAEGNKLKRMNPSRELLELIEQIKQLVKNEAYLETKLPRCKLVTEGFHRLLSVYRPSIIHSKSNMLSSTSTGYDHWFLQIDLNCGTYILDGTYRQFFEGKNINHENNEKRLLLPKYFIGNIATLYELFNANSDLILPIFLKNLNKIETVSRIETFHVADLINELYGRYLKAPAI